MGAAVCNWVRSVLPAYLDGELKPPSARAVRRHLEYCESCRAHLRLIEGAWDLLDEAPRLPVRGGFTSRMMARVVEEKELARLEARLARRGRWREVLAGAVGLAAGLIAGLGLYAWNSLPAVPRGQIEREVSQHLVFLDDADLLDEVAVIQAIERLAQPPPAEGT
jgi:anti-sigma factor RsiW